MATKVQYSAKVTRPRVAIDWRAGLTLLAFGLALALTASRCMLLETIRDPYQVSPGSMPMPKGAGADVSLWLDVLCCVPALLVLARRVVDKTYTVRYTLSHLAMLLLVGWMALSTWWAADKFAAVVAVSNFIAALALLWAMSQLVRSWTRLRLVAAIAYGLLIVFLFKGFYYKFEEIPTMLENQKQMLQQFGVAPGTFEANQFLKKFTEIIGFNSSSNSFAGMIVLLMTIGLGVAIQRLKDHDDVGWAVALLIFAPLSIWLLVYSQSKAALVMPFLAVGILGVVWKYRVWMGRQAKRAYWIGMGVAVLAILAVVGHGLAHHRLPTDSLNFRWRYWVASARMFVRHPVRGVGWENFGASYLRDRLPAASEEIRDPHNFLVRLFVELGAVGGVLVVVWQMRLWWELTRPRVPAAADTVSAGKGKVLEKPQYAPIAFLAGIALTAVVVNAAAAIDFTQSGGWVTVELIYRFLYLLAMVLGALVVALKSLERPRVDERAAPWILYGMLTAIGVFLIHNLIEFSIFETGPLCLFCVLVGAALGVRMGNPPVRKPAKSWGALGVLVVSGAILVAFVIGVVVPITEAEAEAHAADDQLRAAHFAVASDEYASAWRKVPYDAEYAFRAGRALHIEMGPEKLLTDPGQLMKAAQDGPEIRALYEAAIGADPLMIAPYHLMGILALQTGNARELVNNYTRILELNPNEVSLRLEYARALEALNLRGLAREQFKLALQYNDELDAAEPKRLKSDELKAVRDEINALGD
jgi:O-antigen ligase